MSQVGEDVIDDSGLVVGPTITTPDLLARLGFQISSRDGQVAYVFDFGNLELSAVESVSRYFVPVFYFGGVYNDSRSVGLVEFDFPLVSESYEQGVAVIAHNLGRDFKPVNAAQWLGEGRALQDHLPGRASLRMYSRRPQCHVEATWFRLACKKLREAGQNAEDADCALVTFRDGVLLFVLDSAKVPLPATGSPWKGTYSVLTRHFTELPQRVPGEGVHLSVWSGAMSIGRLRLPLATPLP